MHRIGAPFARINGLDVIGLFLWTNEESMLAARQTFPIDCSRRETHWTREAASIWVEQAHVCANKCLGAES